MFLNGEGFNFNQKNVQIKSNQNEIFITKTRS